MPAAITETIPRPDRQVCDRLHGALTPEKACYFSAVQNVAYGPSPTWCDVRDLVDIRGKADIARADLLLFGNDAHPRYRYPRRRQVI
jgi:hypothetical protein